MFKLVQFLIRIMLFLVFLAASPIMLLISIVFVNSFKEAVTDTIEITVSPLRKDTYKQI